MMSRMRFMSEVLAHGVIIALPCVLAIFLVLHRLAPSGVFTVSAGTQDTSPYIDRMLPNERAVDDANGVRIVEDPVYMSIHIPPGGYTTADVTVDFAPSDVPVVEFGALTDAYANNYDLQPLLNTAIATSTWPVVRDGVHSVLDALGRYASVADFFSSVHDRTEIATYHDELPVPYRDPAYRPLTSPQVIDVSLRGYHTYATYIHNETLDATIAFMDMNRTEGGDEGAIRVWNEAHAVVAEVRIPDDGVTRDTQENSGVPERVHLVVGGLPEGVYTVELSGTSDIFWRSITTMQRYVTFVNQVYIADDVGYRAPRATTFVTTAKHLTVETLHADSPDHITVGSSVIALPESHEKVQEDIASPGVVEGSTPVGDVRITGAGLFAFRREAFFNPYPVRMTAYTDVEAEGIATILTTYTPPTQSPDGELHATVTFDLAKVRHPDGTMKCIFSVPGVADTDGVRIDAIHVQFYKPPMSFREVISTLWRHL